MKEQPLILKPWAPRRIRELYKKTFEEDQIRLYSGFPQIRKALYSLGTDIEMESIWKKLLSINYYMLDKKFHEDWLVGEIYIIINSTFVQQTNSQTPQFKKKEIDRIIKQTNKLIDLIIRSLDALIAQVFIVEKNLSYTNLIQREKFQEEIFDKFVPIKKFIELGGILDVEINSLKMKDILRIADLEKDLPPETMREITAESRWNEFTSEQRIAWQVNNARRVGLIDLLNTYIKLLKEIPEEYLSEYVQSPRATIIRKLYEMTNKNYGAYLSDCVTCLTNSILDLQLGIEDITPYKPKEKIS
jgi:hypothetical protein